MKSHQLEEVQENAIEHAREESSNQSVCTALLFSPEGHVYLDDSSTASELLPSSLYKKIAALFTQGSSLGLLHLGIQDFGKELPPSFVFWQGFSRTFITHVCQKGLYNGLVYSEDTLGASMQFEKSVLEQQIAWAPFFKGSEYLSVESLGGVWGQLAVCLHSELGKFNDSLSEYFQLHNPNWQAIGRVCFHLAENKKDENLPFAFLATYATQFSGQSSIQHLPFKKALQDYAGERNHPALVNLLTPVQKVAEKSAFIKELLESGKIFHPQLWSVREAHQFLQEIPRMQECGIVVRVPNWWNSQKPPRPQIVIEVGGRPASSVGFSALLDFNLRLATANGEEITQDEWQEILNTSDTLVKIKGKWVEVDRKKLQTMLSHWENIKKGSRSGLSMAESMRLLASSGSGIFQEEENVDIQTAADWTRVVAGDWLQAVLSELRNPKESYESSVEYTLKEYLRASLRPYQKSGVQWLSLLYHLQIGGCLADDMGLGKTIQILALVVLIKHAEAFRRGDKKPHLLVVPASLLGNWTAEARRFAPSLSLFVAHNGQALGNSACLMTDEQLRDTDMVITTYGVLARTKWLKEISWDLVVLDEAQVIKNAATKNARAVKELKGQVRFALTGTPIENRLGDVWSLFDFTSPGLLGSHKVFSQYVKKAGNDSTQSSYTHFISTLRSLIRPYILRRLKSDKSIISDLPDKTEVRSYCACTKEQIQLYQQAITELKRELKEVEGIKRKGLILSYLTRFKQICNHPAQWLGYGEYVEEASGKFMRLREICEEIALRQEKVLVFTQFKEIIPAIYSLLESVFGRKGLVLDGDTHVKKRAALVSQFQEESGPPFFILSLKAGGTGLTLTRASHVVHFDRWWNPAVENQATDRAYRIGQKHPVLVHKFVCQGTIEEKIDDLIAAKKGLVKDLLDGEEQLSLTQLTNEQLIDLVSIDIKKALGEF